MGFVLESKVIKGSSHACGEWYFSKVSIHSGTSVFTAADCIWRFLPMNYEFMKIVLMKYLSFCELSGICSL